ncbi:hypothetical protein HFD88_006311 [Aspergillus terreus]|nr:hypothetical protein HFD88_006311 [Aspergillus terreus]
MTDPTPNHRPAPKFTRCRTGCLRCRVRRRKCDEGKPRCRNCIDKNFDCHYGLQVTFLPKNSITVDARELQTPETDEKYKIQFVKEDPVAYNTDASAEDSPSPTPHTKPAWFSSSPAKSISTPYNPDDRSISGADNESSSSGRYVDKSQTKSAHGEGKIHGDKIPFSDKDESAIRGLLALGSSAAVNDTSPTVGVPTAVTDFVQRRTLSPRLRECPAAQREGVPSAAPYPLFRETDMSSATEPLSPNSAPIASVPEARKLELLRHYQYHVAPWLDLSDMKRPFGLTVVDIAVKSDILIHAVMELSNACAIQRLSDREYQSRPSFSSHARRLPPNRQGAGLNMNSTELSLFILLDELRTLISHIPTAWKNANCSDPRPQETLVQHAYGTGIESVMYWMFLRLGTSVILY